MKYGAQWQRESDIQGRDSGSTKISIGPIKGLESQLA